MCLRFKFFSPVQCNRAGRGGYYPDRCDPAKFYQCVWGGDSWLGVSMACPAGLIWQQSQKMCNYAPTAEEPEAETLLAEVEGQACRQKDPNGK